MPLSQTQIIRSLGEALQWLEKELAWGTPLQELRHLTGRIGELYVAMITRGQMALAANQQGYDVVSAEGERISVKTVSSSHHVTFQKSTLHLVDRVVILRINLDEGEPSIEELLDLAVEEALPLFKDQEKAFCYPISMPPTQKVDLSRLKETAVAFWRDIRVAQLENGTILVSRNGEVLSPAKPVLREIARDAGVSLLNTMGNAKNTRTLGGDIIHALA
ncbi:hypothetical protein GQY15_00660 [Rhodobacter sphaeroides]|uniref:DUF6998 domain-containing protein n=1 Tax=Cereibacter sphaeroides TaxID=1063 RepID=UPI001327423B|nr:hypothetical protein [Cereibacter sphaeroides]MWP36110.1 hypothetical protein [Cereibacter sphaeroides]